MGTYFFPFLYGFFPFFVTSKLPFFLIIPLQALYHSWNHVFFFFEEVAPIYFYTVWKTFPIPVNMNPEFDSYQSFCFTTSSCQSSVRFLPIIRRRKKKCFAITEFLFYHFHVFTFKVYRRETGEKSCLLKTYMSHTRNLSWKWSFLHF